MKRSLHLFIFSLLLLLWLPWRLAAQPLAFQEGTDYRLLPTPVPTTTGDKVEVVELFWYGCPHCFKLEPVIEEWLKTKPDNAVLVRLPAVLGPNWQPQARAYYVAEQLGVLDKIHRPLFDAMHVQKRPLATPEQLADFFAEQGVDRAAFLDAYKSFAVETRLKRAEQLVRRYGIHGVPALVVNGKYLVDSERAGSLERMLQIVNYLIVIESGNR